jgi:acetyl esterase/lipase
MFADRPATMSRRTALAGVLSMLTTACGRLAFTAANIPAAFGPYQRHADIAYGPDPQHGLDVYVPDRPSTSRPMVVFWHGGRWRFGDKADYRFVGAALTELGCVAVLPNYRHYPDVKMPGFMEDAARAGRWAAEHAGQFGADPSRFYLMGHSAGAHMAAMLTLDPRYFAGTGQPAPPVAGVIGLSGPYDFLPLLEADMQDMFGPPEKFPGSQPINFVHGDAPPMLLIHGVRDDIVWPKNSRNFASALRARGVGATLKLYPKLSHADTVAAMCIPARGRAPTLADIAAFLSAAQAAAAVAAG